MRMQKETAICPHDKNCNECSLSLCSEGKDISVPEPWRTRLLFAHSTAQDTHVIHRFVLSPFQKNMLRCLAWLQPPLPTPTGFVKHPSSPVGKEQSGKIQEKSQIRAKPAWFSDETLTPIKPRLPARPEDGHGVVFPLEHSKTPWKEIPESRAIPSGAAQMGCAGTMALVALSCSSGHRTVTQCPLPTQKHPRDSCISLLPSLSSSKDFQNPSWHFRT